MTCDGQSSHFFDLDTLTLDDNKIDQPPDEPTAYGKAIYQALFPPQTLACNVLESTLTMPSGRLLLVTTDEDIDAVPWEYAYGANGFLVSECHFVRGLPIEQRITSPVLDNGLHIVAIPSNPLSTSVEPLNIDGEWMRLKEIIIRISSAAITLERTHPPTIDQTRCLVANQKHRVIHFMGHGGQLETGAVLCFEKGNGELDLVTAKEFVQRVSGRVFLVTLNACVSATPGSTNFSNLAFALVRYKTPYALGMRFNIFDDDARTFSRIFYSELAHGSSVEEALFQTRLTLAKSSHTWAIGVPVLYTALSTPAEGFSDTDGIPVVDEHQSPIEVSALPRAEGTFQGRIDELKRLGDNLTSDSRPRIITIYGSGGQGKTALAREAVERFAYAWPGGVWAFSLENLPSISVFINSLARLLGIDTKDVLDISRVKQQISARLVSHRTLIVLDNAEVLIEAVEAKDAEAILLAEYLRQFPSSSASLLITSRIQLGWIGETSHEIGGLSPIEGASLFCQCAPQRADEIDIAQAKRLSIKLDGHPFGLRLLGGAYNSTAISLNTFIEEYEALLLRSENKYVGESHRHRTLYTCIETSLRYLNIDLRSLLSGLWVFHASFSPPMTADIFYPNSEDVNQTLSTTHNSLYALWQRGLLTREMIPYDDDGVIEFYRLLPTTRIYVEHYLKQVYESDTLQIAFGTMYSELVKRVSRGLDYSAASSVIALQAYEDFERGSLYVSGIQQGYYFLYWARVLHRLGNPQQALEALEYARKIAQNQDQHLESLVSNHVAHIYSVIGLRQQSLALLEQDLLLQRQMGDRAGESCTLHNMATSHMSAGRQEQALILFKQALHIRREIGNRAGEAATLNNMSNIYHNMKQYEAALAMKNQALQIMREVGDKLGEAATLNGLAHLFQDMHSYSDARIKFEEAITLERQVAHFAGEVAGLVDLALLLHHHFRRSKEAIAYIEQAIAVLSETGLPEDAARRTIDDLRSILRSVEITISATSASIVRINSNRTNGSL